MNQRRPRIASACRAALLVLLRGLTPRRADWGRAMVAELDAVPPDEQIAWIRGVLGVVLRLRLLTARNVTWLLAMAIFGALLVLVDQSPSDVANQASVLILLIGATALGAAVPSARLRTGLVLGSVLAIAHVVYVLLNVRLSYASEPPGLLGALSLFVLVVPAMLAALTGSALRRLVRMR